MNATQSARYRRKLLAMQSDIARQDGRGHDAQRIVELDQQAVGRLSRMDAIQQQAMARATQARRDQMKQKIAAALARLDAGEFGFCISCGNDIAPKRLEFDPAIPTCISCASGA